MCSGVLSDMYGRHWVGAEVVGIVTDQVPFGRKSQQKVNFWEWDYGISSVDKYGNPKLRSQLVNQFIIPTTEMEVGVYTEDHKTKSGKLQDD